MSNQPGWGHSTDLESEVKNLTSFTEPQESARRGNILGKSQVQASSVGSQSKWGKIFSHKIYHKLWTVEPQNRACLCEQRNMTQQCNQASSQDYKKGTSVQQAIFSK